jgi:AraC-like DNA-binding protein
MNDVNALNARRPRAVTVVDLTDPTAAGVGIESIEVDAVQLQAQRFHARRVAVDLGDVEVVLHTANPRLRTRTTPQRDLLGFVVFGTQTRGTVNGVQVRPDLMLAVPAQAEVGFVLEADWQSVTFLVAPSFIESHLAARQRLDELRLPRRVEPMKADGDRVRQLFDLGKRVCDIAIQSPEQFDDSDVERAAAQVEVIEALLAAQRSTSESPLARSDQTRQMQSTVVKAAEDYALAHVGQRIYVSDLCRETATSERTLEIAFKAVMGLTPVQYLTRLRLHRAREALMQTGGARKTVAAIALDWGFWHFGEFARAYRDLFGELPSDTRRRRPAAPP